MNLERLQDDLDDARRTILKLMPDELAEELRGYCKCNSAEEVYPWMSKLVDRLIMCAEIENPESVYDSPRAHCPLCRMGITSGEAAGSGFAVPEGLRRHLRGWGNVSQCAVTEAAYKLALGYARMLER